MRDIKFRAWDGKRMKQPSHNLSVNSYNGEAYWQWGYEAPEEMPDYILMQYTGLEDKNGVEIYEGDILSWLPWEHDSEPQLYLYQVIYEAPSFKYAAIKNAHYIGGTEPLKDLDEFKVIGNIYENKDLLI